MLVVLSRSQWGALDFPRLGDPVDPLDRSEVFIHHTAIARRVSNPNEWGRLDDVRAAMVQLQTARPDLGRDVPYTMVGFCMANGDLILCEGRGIDRSGAHTAGHNQSALGIAFAGNFEDFPPPGRLETHTRALAGWLRQLRNDLGFANLGMLRPDDRDVWGHRDVRNTLCPGRHLYENLQLIRFLEKDELMDKATWQLVQAGLQALDPPLYSDKAIDGLPGRNTNIAVQAFERRLGLEAHGVIGALGDANSGMWPATRELLFITVYSPRIEEHQHEVQLVEGPSVAPIVDVQIGRVMHT